MRSKIAAILAAVSLVLTGCGSVNEEPAGVTAPAAGVTTEAPWESIETSAQTQAPETEAASDTTQESAETSAKKRKFTTMTEPPPELTEKGIIRYARPSPEYEVSAEDFAEFEKEIGFSLSVPEDAQNVAYQIDAEVYKGTLIFYLGDVLWDAKVRPVDKERYYRGEPYVDEYMTELDCEFESGQVTTLRGVEGDIRYYRITYPDNSEAYNLSATWYLEDEG